jgi:exopolyphosphatase / guanosine-5'-triphosphate,3'-diphosphate pyrophosphatase
MKIAVLDLGTNTFHLLIAEVEDTSKWKKLLHSRITVKIGKGGINKKVIAKPAYLRGIRALGKFRETINRNNVKRIAVFGTAALRNAENGQQFLDEVKKKFNFDIQLITGDEEASLIYYGVRRAVDLGENKSLIMDIGGGSVEFIIANEDRIFWKQSFKLGAALLSDKFQPSDPLTSKDLKSINAFLNQELEPLINACQLHLPRMLIGSAGSFETFASMLKHRFPDAGSHYGKLSHPIDIYNLTQLHNELVVSDAAKRKTMRGLIKMRVDMIVMASLLLKFVLDQTKIEEIKLSAYSLKEGALWKVISDK